MEARLLRWLVGVLVAMEILALSGAVHAPHAVLSWDHASPFMAGVLGVAVFVLCSTRPRGRAIGAAIAVAIAIAASSGGRPRVPIVAGYSLGLASLVVLGARAWRSAEARPAFARAAIFPVFFMSTVTGLGLTSLLHPRTFDGALLHLDSMMVGAPSFVLGRWFAAIPALAWVCEVVYRWLPLAAGVVFVAPRRAGTASHDRVLATFVISGVLGFSLYHACPATGPLYAFRPGFPAVTPILAEVPWGPMPVPPFDRNCVPSLHTTWALLLLWFSRGRGPIVRGGAVFWLVCTLLATLGLGEHYLVDLVIAVPFAVMVHALGAIDLPISHRERRAPIVVGAALVALWMGLVRHAAEVPSALVPALAALSVALPLALNARLAGLAPRAEEALATPRTTTAPPKAIALSLLLGAAASVAWVIGYLATPMSAPSAAALGAAALGAWLGRTMDARKAAIASVVMSALAALSPRFALVPVSLLAAAALSSSRARGAFLAGFGLAAPLTSYALLPVLGFRLSALPALVIALVAALIALRIGRDEAPPEERGGVEIALAASFVVALFVDRVTRSIGDTAYTPSLVITAAAIGVGAGALIRAKLGRPRPLPLAIAAVIVVVACAPWGAGATWAAFDGYRRARDFGAIEVIRLALLAAVITPPMALLGAARGRLDATLAAAAISALLVGNLVRGRAPSLPSITAVKGVTRESIARAKTSGSVTISVPLDAVSEEDVITILATAHAELPRVWVHVRGSWATVLACASACEALHTERWERVVAPPEIDKLLGDHARVSTGDLVMTDDDVRVAWRAPREKGSGRAEILRANLRLFQGR